MQREQHPVDQVFREALHGDQIRPSDASRKQFLEEASTILAAKKRKRFRWIFMGIALGFLLGTTLGFLFLYPESGDSRSAQSTRSTTLISDNAQDPMTTSSAPPATTWLQPTTMSDASTTKPNSTPPNSPSQTTTVKENKSSFNLHLTPLKKEINPAPSLPQQTIDKVMANLPDLTSQTVPDTKDDILQELAFKQAPDIEVISLPGTLSEPINQENKDPLNKKPTPSDLNSETQFSNATTSGSDETTSGNSPKKWNESKPWRWALGLSYSPEWMFNTLEGTKYVNNMALEFSVRYQKYSIRTGIGLSITEGTNELLVEYNDYLGNYQKLDSLTFAWDDKHYYLIPTYYTSNTDVWDSLMQLDYPTIIKRYTYLQIPLILGYDILRTKRFALGFRAGPQLSILLGTKQLTDDYDPGRNRVIRVNQVTPDRISTNWQVTGGISASYKISPMFTLELEPNIRYYFNSVYEKGDGVKKPWSLGFRAAISISP